MSKLKTSLYVEPELDHALTRAAAKARLSKAEFMRRALAEAVRDTQVVRPGARGVFDGPADAADDVDRYLDSTGFGA